MKTLTQEQALEAVERIWNGEYLTHLKVHIHYSSDQKCTLRISTMYEFVPLSFKHLKGLEELFGTDDINEGERDSNPGCETCDYGSKYELTFHIGQ